MGKYMRKCKLIGEVAVMAELDHVGVRTRARTLAMETARATKRTKVTARRELEFCSSYNQLQKNQNRRRLVITPDLPISPATSDNNSGSTIVMSDRCSSNGSCELVSGSLMRSFVDLEEEGLKFENSTFFFNQRESDLSSESNDLESTARPSEANSRRRLTPEKMPSDAEIEDFFSAFEKDEEKRFSEKYNYDIVKDVPLDGRYEWIPVKP